MKAILCKYYGQTNTKPSRIIATAEGVKPLTIGYPHELSGEDCYKKAAIALCERMDWNTDLIGGCLPNGDYVFCFLKGYAKNISQYRMEFSGKVKNSIGSPEPYIDVTIHASSQKEAQEKLYNLYEHIQGLTVTKL